MKEKKRLLYNPPRAAVKRESVNEGIDKIAARNRQPDLQL